MAEQKRPIHECKRCGYMWMPKRGDIKPITCPNPKCRSPYWDRPRRGKKNTNSNTSRKKK